MVEAMKTEVLMVRLRMHRLSERSKAPPPPPPPLLQLPPGEAPPMLIPNLKRLEP